MLNKIADILQDLSCKLRNLDFLLKHREYFWSENWRFGKLITHFNSNSRGFLTHNTFKIDFEKKIFSCLKCNKEIPFKIRNNSIIIN